MTAALAGECRGTEAADGGGVRQHVTAAEGRDGGRPSRETGVAAWRERWGGGMERREPGMRAWMNSGATVQGSDVVRCGCGEVVQRR